MLAISFPFVCLLVCFFNPHPTITLDAKEFVPDVVRIAPAIL